MLMLIIPLTLLIIVNFYFPLKRVYIYIYKCFDFMLYVHVLSNSPDEKKFFYQLSYCTVIIR